VVRRLAAVLSSGLLAAVLAAGCSAGVPASYRATVQTCSSFGLRAIQRHVTVTAEPGACAGLSPEQVNAAVTRAVKTAVGPVPKAIARHLAVQDSAYLARMLRTIQPPKSAPPGTTPTRPSGGVPLGLAAMIAWIVTAAAGSYLLAGWLAAGGLRRRRPAASLVPVTVLSHFGLAVAGLGLWIAFVSTGTRVLAWVGVGLIVLIAGLGMGALSAALPEPGRSASQAGPGSAGPGPGPGQPQADRRSSKAGTPVAVIAVHGMLATATILLVLLAAIGAG
jgi:hypothetical protein